MDPGRRSAIPALPHRMRAQSENPAPGQTQPVATTPSCTPPWTQCPTRAGLFPSRLMRSFIFTIERKVAPVQFVSRLLLRKEYPAGMAAQSFPNLSPTPRLPERSRHQRVTVREALHPTI